MPTASAAPAASSASASAGSWMREVAISGTVSRLVQGLGRCPDDVPCDRGRRHDPGRAEVARRVSDHGARVVDQALARERAQDGGGLRGMAALGQRFVGGEPDSNREPVARAASHRLQHCSDVVQAPLRVAAPGVVALIRALAQELRRQVAVGRAQLDAVEARRARVAGDQFVVRDDLLDLAGAECAGLDLEALARHGGRSHGGCPRRGFDLLAAAVEELHEQTGAARVHGLRDTRQPLDDAWVVARDRVAGEQAAGVDGRGLDADQPGAALARAAW